MKNLKKFVSVFLAVLMILTVAPLQGFTDLDFSGLSSVFDSLFFNFGAKASETSTGYKWRVSVYIKDASSLYQDGYIRLYYSTDNARGEVGEDSYITLSDGVGNGTPWKDGSDNTVFSFVSDSSVEKEGTALSTTVTLPDAAFPVRVEASATLSGNELTTPNAKYQVKLEVFNEAGELVTDSEYGSEVNPNSTFGEEVTAVAVDETYKAFYPYAFKACVTGTTYASNWSTKSGTNSHSGTDYIDVWNIPTLTDQYGVNYSYDDTDVHSLFDEIFERENYYFNGWNTKEDGSGDCIFGINSLSVGNNTLYADWVNSDDTENYVVPTDSGVNEINTQLASYPAGSYVNMTLSGDIDFTDTSTSTYSSGITGIVIPSGITVNLFLNGHSVKFYRNSAGAWKLPYVYGIHNKGTLNIYSGATQSEVSDDAAILIANTRVNMRADTKKETAYVGLEGIRNEGTLCVNQNVHITVVAKTMYSDAEGSSASVNVNYCEQVTDAVAGIYNVIGATCVVRAAELQAGANAQTVYRVTKQSNEYRVNATAAAYGIYGGRIFTSKTSMDVFAGSAAYRCNCTGSEMEDGRSYISVLSYGIVSNEDVDVIRTKISSESNVFTNKATTHMSSSLNAYSGGVYTTGNNFVYSYVNNITSKAGEPVLNDDYDGAGVIRRHNGTFVENENLADSPSDMIASNIVWNPYYQAWPFECATELNASGSCGDNLTWTYNYKTDTLSISGTGAMTDWSSDTEVPWYAYRDKIICVDIAKGVTSIGAYAFYGFSQLVALEIPEGVTSIGDGMIKNCDNLASLSLPNSLKEWNMNAICKISLKANDEDEILFEFFAKNIYYNGEKKNVHIAQAMCNGADVTWVAMAYWQSRSKWTELHFTSGYSSAAAVEYAKRYALSYNKEWYFYYDGGDCANFVSQCLFAGGYQMTANWYSYDNKTYAYKTDELGKNEHTWIRANALKCYLVDNGGELIQAPSSSDFSLGDAVFYDRNNDGRMEHSAIVTAIENGVPKVSYHSDVNESNSRLNEEYTLGKKDSQIYLVKLHGNTCYNNDAESYDIYQLNSFKSNVKIYSNPNAGTILSKIKIGTEPKTVRVTDTSDGSGYINYMGTKGWVSLSKTKNLGSWSKIEVSHDMSGWYVAKKATCANAGYQLNVCTKCGYTQLKPIEKTAHKTVPATCIMPAYCSVCSKVLDLPLGHSWDSGVITTAPTCTAAGVKTYTCTRCAITKTVAVSANGHTWGEYVTTKEPTCTLSGEKTSTCSVCLTTRTQEISPLGHDLEDETVVPTCTLGGYTKSTCQRDGCTYSTTSNETAATGHALSPLDEGYENGDDKMELVSSVENVCGDGTIDTYQCTHINNGERCTYIVVIGEEQDHNMSGWYTQTEPTCYETGLKVNKCTNDGCTYMQTEVIEALGHDWGEWVENGDGTHSKTCKRDSSHVETEDCTFGEWVTTKEATCEEAGEKERSCTVCGFTQTQQLEPIGHAWGEWTDNDDGATHTRVCENDSSHTETADHNNTDGVVVTAPTCTTDGEIKYICNTCSAQQSETVPATGHDYQLDEDNSPEATCTEDGYDLYVCANDASHTYTEEKKAYGHDMSEWVDYPPESGCGEGRKESVCQNDGCDYIEEEYYYLEHFFGDPVTVPGTCCIQSYTTIECENCGYVEVSNYGDTDPDNHADYEQYVDEDVAPTCTEDGKYGDTCCSGCNAVLIEGAIIPATGHDWGEWEENGDGTHTRVCENDSSHTETEDCTFGDWTVTKPETCTESGEKERTCTVCGYVETEVINPKNHKWGEWEENSDGTHTRVCENDSSHTETEDCSFGDWTVTKPETCTESGEKERTCTVCGYVETEVINPKNHKWGEWEENSDGTHTRVCENDSNHTETEDCTFGDWTVTKPETCTESGEKERTCTVCGYVETEVINPKNHKWGEWEENGDGTHTRVCENDSNHTETEDCTFGDWTVTKPETCTESGEKERTCTVCGYVETEVINPKNHKWGEWEENSDGTHTRVCENDSNHTETQDCTFGDWTVTKPETCTESGEKERTCTVCGYVETEVINPKNHKWGEWEENSDGTHTRVCENDSNHTETEDCLFGDWTVTKPETCTESGEKERTCTVCGYVETETINPKNHKWGEWEENSDGTHTRVCENDSTHTETEDCTFGDWTVTKPETCTESGEKERTCTVCGYVETETINPKNHKWGEWEENSDGTHTRICENDSNHTENEDCTFGEWTVTKPETCTESGEKERTCTVCGYVETETINPKNHKWGEWEENSDGTHTRVCENDSNHTETQDCTFGDWTVTKPETCTESGEKERTCTVCGYVETEVINPKNHKWGEWTENGDGTHTRVCENDSSHTENEDCTFGDWTVTKPETCTESGEKERTCTVCGYVETEVINPKNHKWGEWEENSDGTHTRVCENDSTHTETEDCTFGDWKITKEPTTEANGEKERSCKVCGYTQTESIDKLISYTATFIVADENGTYVYDGNNYKVVDVVPFAAGTTAIVNPDIPEISGYIGYWESYTLSDRDIVIKGCYELKSSDNQSNLESDKSVVYKDGEATVTLSAFAQTLNAKVPMGAKEYNVILVLDQSSSMKNNKIGSETRLQVLQRVTKDFIDKIYESADENGVDHKVAIVGFSAAGSGYSSTGLLTPSGTLKKYNTLTSSDYANAYVSVKDNRSQLYTTVNNLSTSTGTSADLGLDMARQIIANDDSERDTIVIFITDGEPTLTGSFDSSIANTAVQYANQIKNLYNTPIYAIGVAAGANPEDESSNINKFLHAVSSNYPSAGSISKLGTAGAMKSYFLTADDSETLSDIFDSIAAQQIVNTISFTKVSFFDTVTEYFTFTAEKENEFRNSVKSEYGVTDDDITVTRNADGTTFIKVDNLIPKPVFNNNIQTGWGAEISFSVSANEKTLDGGAFATNTEEAGIESNGTTVIDFKIPENVNISSGRAIVEFRIGDEVYAIKEVAVGSTVIPPETDIAEWVITDGEVVKSDYTVYNAQYTTEERTVTWHIGENTVEEAYHIGQVITPPEVDAAENTVFLGWSSTVPYKMGSTNLEFTAVFGEHKHEYTLVSTKGECLTGVTRTYECACGATYSETQTYSAHTYTANVQLVNDESVATMLCTVCGQSESKKIKYQAVYSSDRTTNSGYGGRYNGWGGMNSNDKISNCVDLTLSDGEIAVQPDGYIYVQLYVSSEILSYAKKGTLTVKRINEDNSVDSLTYLSNSAADKAGYYTNGDYLVLKLDHFSYYLLTSDEYKDSLPSYEQLQCAFDGHSYSDKVTAATCTSDGYTVHTCSRCGDTYTSDTTTALGHDMGEFVTKKEPTCTEEGIKMSECSRCDYSESEKIPATGHNFENGTCTECGEKQQGSSCSCNCHKTGFMGFIWKIQRFIYKLFKIHPTCSCGAAHY